MGQKQQNLNRKNFKKSVGEFSSNCNWKDMTNQETLLKVIYKTMMISAEKEFGKIKHTRKLKPWWNHHCTVSEKIHVQIAPDYDKP